MCKYNYTIKQTNFKLLITILQIVDEEPTFCLFKLAARKGTFKKECLVQFFLLTQILEMITLDDLHY